MFVCICHALTNGDVSAAKAGGAASDAAVFRHFGVEPQCGCCADSIQCLLACQEATGGSRHTREDRAPCASRDGAEKIPA